MRQSEASFDRGDSFETTAIYCLISDLMDDIEYSTKMVTRYDGSESSVPSRGLIQDYRDKVCKLRLLTNGVGSTYHFHMLPR